MAGVVAGVMLVWVGVLAVLGGWGGRVIGLGGVGDIVWAVRGVAFDVGWGLRYSASGQVAAVFVSNGPVVYVHVSRAYPKMVIVGKVSTHVKTL